MFNQTQGAKGATVGNPNTEGNKKSNYSWQSKMLQILGQINGAIPAAACCPTAATEATLLSVLTALQNGQEFEQNMVTDLGGVGCPGNCPTYLQIRIFNTETHIFDPPIYYDAAGTVVVPTGPLQFVNPLFVLENILTQAAAINADLDVALSTRASETTLALTLLELASINTAFDLPMSTLNQNLIDIETAINFHLDKDDSGALTESIASTSTAFVDGSAIDLAEYQTISIVPEVTAAAGTNADYRIQWSMDGTNDWFDETIDVPATIAGSPAESVITQGTMIRRFPSGATGVKTLSAITLTKRARYIRISQRSDAAATNVTTTYNYQLLKYNS